MIRASRATAAGPPTGRRSTRRWAKALSRFDAAQMAEALRTANIAFGRYNTVGEFARHVQLRRAEVDTPSGPVSVPAPPQIFDRYPVALRPSPAIGEHSERIRREFASES